ncbi:MAG: N-acetylmuramoyl-L-alanine amidase [Rhodobiaceae bacterium]|nr:MAG: N-acetylmuramoyl-L-alanine amidase [Rhodobiaceae bacterium]
MPLQDKISRRPSPNWNERLLGTPDILLLHYTGMVSGEEALDRLCDAQSQVSAHYLVFEDGRIVCMVEEIQRAWHAGVAEWGGVTDINSRSIGVEIVNPGHDLGYPDFPEQQVEAVIALSRDVVSRQGIARTHVLAHSDVAPGRKADPGEKFPWARLASEGVGHWITPVENIDGPVLKTGDRGDSVAELQFQLADYGYGIVVDGRYGAGTAGVVTAFQRHFRPARVDGAADLSTVGTLRLLRDAR